MDEDGFEKFLEKLIGKKGIQQSIRIVKEAEVFLNNKGKIKDFSQASIEDLQFLVRYFLENRKNTWEKLFALLRYSRFVGNREIEVALLELLDGSDVLENLSNKVRKSVGERRHREIFEGIKIPPLGTFSTEKPKNLSKK